ncbi:MAG: hypothetical protein ABI607_11595 [Betaproteobacteria bacterium]
MNKDEPAPGRSGLLARARHGLATPSARWSVLALVIVGLLIGAGVTITTQVMVAATGTNEFARADWTLANPLPIAQGDSPNPGVPS